MGPSPFAKAPPDAPGRDAVPRLLNSGTQPRCTDRGCARFQTACKKLVSRWRAVRSFVLQLLQELPQAAAEQSRTMQSKLFVRRARCLLMPPLSGSKCVQVL